MQNANSARLRDKPVALGTFVANAVPERTNSGKLKESEHEMEGRMDRWRVGWMDGPLPPQCSGNEMIDTQSERARSEGMTSQAPNHRGGRTQLLI